jgi:hypothetical protein
MSIVIVPDIVLLFYDLPILFIGVDQVSTKYLALQVDSIEGKARYLCRPVSSDTIIKLVKKSIDLRAAYLENDVERWYFLDTQDENNFHLPKQVPFSDIPAHYIPEPGIVLDYSLDVDQKLVEDAYSRDKALVCISFNEGVKQSINAYSLAEVVNTFQSTLKYMYKKAMSELSTRIKELIDTPNGYMLNAYASKAGSFKLYFESDSSRSLFDGFDIRYALDRVESLVVDDDEAIIINLRRNSGHAISSYTKLLQAIQNSGVSVKLEWIDPNGGKTVSRAIAPEYAYHVLEIIKARSDLETVVVELIGSFELEDTKTGNWRLVDSEGKRYTGTGDGELLKGKTTDTVVYRLTCEELILEENVSGKEIRKYVLKNVEGVGRSANR